jgi:hypothetical protein
MSSVLIATPVSHLFNNPKDAEAIIRRSDCLEARERTIHLHFGGRRLFHVDIDVTHPWSSERRNYITQCISQLPELRLITFQATVNCDQPELKAGQFLPGGRRFSDEEMKEHARLNITWLRKILSGDVQIGIENNNYYPTEAYETVTDAGFLRSIVEENGIRFLFDIAHAVVTAHNRGITLDDYIKGLPMTSCIQLHLCQPQIRSDGLAIDAHDVPEGEVLSRARKLIEDHQIAYLTVEYYKDAERLIAALDEERRYFHECGD